MINLAQEESYKLSAKDRYDILSFAIEAADDGGFVSSFVFERAMYLYAAIILDEDRADDIIKTCKIYNRDYHNARFALPNYLKNLL